MTSGAACCAKSCSRSASRTSRRYSTRFGRHRLLSFDRDPVTRGPTVEIAHEALLAEWDRLRGWIDANREDVRQQRRLAAAADEWQAAGRDADYLLERDQARPASRLGGPHRPVAGSRRTGHPRSPASTGEARSKPPKRTAAATKRGFGCGPAGAPAC